MLVPSTRTGWYRNKMIRIDTAAEMSRSRTHNPRPEFAARCAGPAISAEGVATAEEEIPVTPGS